MRNRVFVFIAGLLALSLSACCWVFQDCTEGDGQPYTPCYQFHEDSTEEEPMWVRCR